MLSDCAWCEGTGNIVRACDGTTFNCWVCAGTGVVDFDYAFDAAVADE